MDIGYSTEAFSDLSSPFIFLSFNFALHFIIWLTTNCNLALAVKIALKQEE